MKNNRKKVLQFQKNMKLFLKVGSEVKPIQPEKTSLRYEDLFNEKGELK